MTDLNIIVGVRSGDAIRQLSNVQKGVDNVGAATKRTTQQLKQHATQYNKTAVAANKFGKGLAQQAGYQVADFAVQLQNGTSFLQAFGQQGSQMLAVFGPLGSVLGAVVAVGAALGTVFVKSTGATKDFKDQIQSLKDETAQAAMEFEMLAKGVKSYGQVAILNELSRIDKELSALFTKQGEIVEKRNSKYKQQLRNNRASIQLLQAERENLQYILDRYDEQIVAKDKALRISEKMNAVELAHASIIGDQLQAVENIRDGYNQYYNSRIAAATVAAREETKALQQSHADQLRIMGETTQQAIANAAKARQAYAEYYASRIQGEIDAQAAQNEVRGGRGGPTFQELYDNDPRVQLSHNLMMLRMKEQREKEAADAKALASAKKFTSSLRQEISPEMQRIIDLSNSIGSSFENAMMSAVRGTMSVKDAFRTMAADIIAELYRVFVVKQITGFISNAIMGGMGYTPVEGGGYTMRPRARPRAAGGPVSAGSPYLVGERGPELIVPNRSGTVIPNNKLGGGGVVVNQVINISTGVQQTVRAEIRQLMPQIADSAKAAVSDAKRRGGSYGRAFA